MIKNKLLILSMTLLTSGPLKAAYDPFDSLKNSATGTMISFGTYLKTLSGGVLIASLVLAFIFQVISRVTEDMEGALAFSNLSRGAGFFGLMSAGVYIILWSLLR